VSIEWVRLDEVVEFDRTPIKLDPDAEYERLGIYSWGKGHFVREPALGLEMGKMNYFTFPRPALIFSNIQAWEGAVALADEADETAVCSSRFYPYVPRADSDVSLHYLFEFFRSSIGQQIMREKSSGTQVRNKLLSRSGIEAALIPLPLRKQQVRIANHLDSLARSTPAASLDLASRAHAVAEQAFLGRFETLPLSSLAEIGPKPERLKSDDKVAFVPMAAVSADTGRVEAPEYRTRGDVGTGYRQFRTGDVIFARITPSMQNGKSAVFDDPTARIGYGSTEFHVIRPHDLAHSRWIWAVLRTKWLRDLAVRSFTGTAGQQRVPASFLEEVRIPVPTDSERDAALDHLVDFQSTLARLEATEARRNTLAAALLPAARNEIFNSMR
jgi:type I restriction enzyme S subunit